MITLDEKEFRRIVVFVRDRYGINLEKKFALVQARLSLDIERRGFGSFKDYFDKIFSDPKSIECQCMIDKLSTNHTFFFRETGCINHMRRTAIPEMLKDGVNNFMIWCAASSSGQECYSVAMVLEDMLSLSPGRFSYSIMGSDINTQVLAAARAGVYPIAELEKIPSSYQKRFCRIRSDGFFEVSDELKRRMFWFRQNLMQPFTLSRTYHIIFCRNVMIYFAPEAKKKLIYSLNKVLRTGGYLYLGTTETADSHSELFTHVAPSILRRKQKERYHAE